MYIRRKVYSIPAEQEEYDYNDEERYFSDYEERLYSTGDNELDEVLERAFCEGYEYAQKEFSLQDLIEVYNGFKQRLNDGEKLSDSDLRMMERTARRIEEIQRRGGK